MAIKVKKDELNPETPEVLAASIIKISTALEKLVSDELNPDALVALIKYMPGMAQTPTGDIRLVLRKLKELRGYYVRNTGKK